MRQVALGLLALLVLTGPLTTMVSVPATAQANLGPQVSVPARYQDVLEGTSVLLQVTFGLGSNTETVAVNCNGCTTTWTSTVRFEESKPNCSTTNTQRRCTISFPENFRDVREEGPRPADAGEPSRRAVYTATVGQGTGEAQSAKFRVWISTTHTCRQGEATRSDVVLLSTSGHAAGDTIRVRIYDHDRNRLAFEEERTSIGRAIAYNLLWEVPLRYDLGPNKRSLLEVQIDSPSKSEKETFVLLPAYPEIFKYAEPGANPQDIHYNRTEKVRYWFQLAFVAAPLDCEVVPWQQRIIPVFQRDLQLGFLRGRAVKIDTISGIQNVEESVEELEAHYVPVLGQFWLNWTIPRDANATKESAIAGQPGSPEYKLNIPDQPMRDGNYVREFNTTIFRVHPYRIEPRIEFMTRDVERLERAEVIFNITYADGSPFTPDDVGTPLEVEFREVGDEPPIEVLEANHLGAGLWNVSVDIPWEYDQLGEYVWHLRENVDVHGDPGFHNDISELTTDVFDIVGARPVLDFRTFVGEDQVNGTERTRTVHVTLHAAYKNGVPLTSTNVDPSLGGVVLNVKKKNAQGRILDVDSLIMTDADGQGNWVRTFRVGRSSDEAPAGNWDLEVVARNNRDPPDENVTAFPFKVEPARIVVSPVREPQDLVRGGEVRYDVRLTYPDGSLFTEELANQDRGAQLQARLERVNFLGDRIVEDSQRPRPVEGGSLWRTTVDADRLVPGAHYFNITGRDIYGNIVGPHTGRLFTVLFNGEFRNSTTPICGDIELSGQDSRPCTLPRGSDIFALFPKSEGDKGYVTAEPVITVFRKIAGEDRWVIHRNNVKITDEQFLDLTGQNAGLNHVGLFRTDETTPTGRYLLFILGRSQDDSGFAGYSQQFEIAAIVVERKVITKLPLIAEKGETLTAVIQKEPGDVIDSAVVRAGPVTSRAVRATPTALGTFVQWTPDRSAPSGPATIEITGRDLFGNSFRVSLGPVELQPLDVRIEVLDDPPAEVARNTFARMEARLFFPDGLAYTSRHGTPEVLVKNELGEVVGEGVARFFSGHWFFDWTPPPDFPVENVHYEVSGRDPSGNLIEGFTSRPFKVVPGVVKPQFPRNPTDISRGQVARAVLEFPNAIANLSAIVTTGPTEIAPAQVSVQGTRVSLAYPTDRTSPLVQARFRVTGLDEYGNRLDGDSGLFRVNPQAMRIRFLQQPAEQVQKGERVVVDFVIEYPDGTRLRPGQGIPIVGLFARDRPIGAIQSQPRQNDPTIFRVTWDPPENVLTSVPYRFVVSSLDRWQNEALPASTRGFFISDPLVPDYLPIPFTSPASIVALAVGLALLMRERDRFLDRK